MPPRWSPVPRLDLNAPPGWLLAWQLDELRRDHSLCLEVLEAPAISASTIADRPLASGCGWSNAVAVRRLGDVQFSTEQLTCDMAAALALWTKHDVQPLAQQLLGQPVRSFQHMGTYACRNIIGSAASRRFRSQHAQANAVDLAGVTLAGGHRLSVKEHWASPGPEGQFLREIHASSCRYFRVSLGPRYNAAHHDHFHFDRGPAWRCQ